MKSKTIIRSKASAGKPSIQNTNASSDGGRLELCGTMRAKLVD